MIVRVSPGSPSQWMATLSPLPASTWRSRQLYATFNVPPSNQRAFGICQSSVVCHGSAQSSSSAACFAQKPSSSSAASS